MNSSTTETVFEFVRDFLTAKGYAPSHREIAAECHISTGSVTGYLIDLEQQGRITRIPGQPRSIRLRDKTPAAEIELRRILAELLAVARDLTSADPARRLPAQAVYARAEVFARPSSGGYRYEH